MAPALPGLAPRALAAAAGLIGFLAIGSADAGRFHPGISIDFIERLGELIAAAIGYGIVATIGFPVLLLRRPDPWPSVFGYHEVWHGFTVLAAMLLSPERDSAPSTGAVS